MAMKIRSTLAFCGLLAILFTGLMYSAFDPISARNLASVVLRAEVLPLLHQNSASPPHNLSIESTPPDPDLSPAVFFVDVETGPATGGPGNLGIPISIFGKGFGAERGNSKVTIGGSEVASYLVWGAGNAHNKTLDMIVVQPGPNCKGGPIVVTVSGKSSNSEHSFAVNTGSIYFLAPNGSDSRACSLSAPCATILYVVSKMKPGDSVLLRGGNYPEGEIWIRAPQGGSARSPKLIKNYPGEQVYLGNAARGFLVDADYITVAGLNFQNGKFLGAVGWATPDQRGNRFIDNTFIGVIGWAAIEIGGNDHLLAGNVCQVSGSTVGTMGHCYYVTRGKNIKILYNIASGASGYGLHIYEERRANQDIQRVISNVLVEGNILKNSTQRSGMIVSISDAGGYGNHIEDVTIRNNIFTANNHAGLVLQGMTHDVKVYHNTFYQNGILGIYVEGDPKLGGVDIRNNLIYQTPNSNCSTECSASPQPHVLVGAGARDVTLAGNFYYPAPTPVPGFKDVSAVTGNVHFANAAALDFHVHPPSVTIDRGVALPAVPTDYDGKRRPQGAGYDVGAFEY